MKRPWHVRLRYFLGYRGVLELMVFVWLLVSLALAFLVGARTRVK